MGEVLFSNEKAIKSADTIDGLAEKLGLPGKELAATIARYNEMIDAGEDTIFGRFRDGITPPLPVTEPSFYGAQFFPIARKSMGGIRVDASCRVLDAEGRPIAGLFAAGEATGFGGLNGSGALEGTFLGPSIAMGRIAGRNGAGKPARSAVAIAAANLPLARPGASSVECQTCHPLSELTGQNRLGYWHFERSHRMVNERKLDCAACHAEIGMPYERATHRTNRGAQIDTCKQCH